MRLLIVDNDYNILENTKKYLEHFEFTVFTANCVKEAEKILSAEKINLIVLEVMLDGGCGYVFCRKLKSKRNIPVIFISSLSSEQNIIKGLLCGGDDYLIKPYSMEELKIRILKRIRDDSNIDEYNLNGIIIRNSSIICYNKTISLTSKEIEILLLLWNNRGTYFTSQEIFNTVWRQIDNNDVRTVKYHLHNLKKKLKEAYPDKIYIYTKWGSGYAFK